jgi:hypothetical protein
MVDILKTGGSLPKGTRRLPEAQETHPTGESEPETIDNNCHNSGGRRYNQAKTK